MKRRASLLLTPGATLPADLTIVAAVTSLTRGECYVILEGEGLPEQAPGCRAVEFGSLARLDAYRMSRMPPFDCQRAECEHRFEREHVHLEFP